MCPHIFDTLWFWTLSKVIWPCCHFILLARVNSRICQNFEDCRKHRQINTESQENKETAENFGKQKTEAGATVRPQQALPTESCRDPFCSRKGRLIEGAERDQIVSVHCQRSLILTNKSLAKGSCRAYI